MIIFLTANANVNVVLDFRVEKFGGFTNLQDGILSVLGISPIGIGLHEPVLICWPLVSTLFAQKLMKLLEEVNEAAVPLVALFRPSDFEAKLIKD